MNARFMTKSSENGDCSWRRRRSMSKNDHLVKEEGRERRGVTTATLCIERCLKLAMPAEVLRIEDWRRQKLGRVPVRGVDHGNTTKRRFKAQTVKLNWTEPLSFLYGSLHEDYLNYGFLEQPKKRKTERKKDICWWKIVTQKEIFLYYNSLFSYIINSLSLCFRLFRLGSIIRHLRYHSFSIV